MISKPLIIVCGVLAILLGAALVAIKVLKGDVADLAAEKATVQSELDAARMDLTASVKNSDRMLLEKDAQLAFERRLSQATLQVSTQVATTRGDIAHAVESTKCTESDPVAVALDGMRKLEQAGPFLGPFDRIPPAGRTGKASKPGYAAGTASGIRRQGAR